MIWRNVATAVMCRSFAECVFNINPIISSGLCLLLGSSGDMYLGMIFHLKFSPAVFSFFLSVFLPLPLSLSFLLVSPFWWMDRSCISNLAVLLMQLRDVTSLRAGEPSGAERRNGVTKRTRHLGNREGRKNRKHNAAERMRDKAKERARTRERDRKTERDGCLVVSEECLLSALSVVSL